VSADRLRQSHRRLAGEIRQRQGHRQGEPSRVKPEAELRCEPARELEPARDPALLLPQEFRDGLEAEPIVLGERGDDAGLVHGTYGLSRRVGGEDPCLHGDARDRLDDNRDLTLAFGTPAKEAFEAVEDFKDAFSDPGDAQGQRLKVARINVRVLAAQVLEARAQELRRDEVNEAHGASSERGRIW
jgi:hypothetical protein